MLKIKEWLSDKANKKLKENLYAAMRKISSRLYEDDGSLPFVVEDSVDEEIQKSQKPGEYGDS